ALAGQGAVRVPPRRYSHRRRADARGPSPGTAPALLPAPPAAPRREVRGRAVARGSGAQGPPPPPLEPVLACFRTHSRRVGLQSVITPPREAVPWSNALPMHPSLIHSSWSPDRTHEASCRSRRSCHASSTKRLGTRSPTTPLTGST